MAGSSSARKRHHRNRRKGRGTRRDSRRGWSSRVRTERGPDGRRALRVPTYDFGEQSGFTGLWEVRRLLGTAVERATRNRAVAASFCSTRREGRSSNRPNFLFRMRDTAFAVDCLGSTPTATNPSPAASVRFASVVLPCIKVPRPSSRTRACSATRTRTIRRTRPPTHPRAPAANRGGVRQRPSPATSNALSGIGAKAQPRAQRSTSVGCRPSQSTSPSSSSLPEGSPPLTSKRAPPRGSRANARRRRSTRRCPLRR